MLYLSSPPAGEGNYHTIHKSIIHTKKHPHHNKFIFFPLLSPTRNASSSFISPSTKTHIHERILHPQSAAILRSSMLYLSTPPVSEGRCPSSLILSYSECSKIRITHSTDPLPQTFTLATHISTEPSHRQRRRCVRACTTYHRRL